MSSYGKITSELVAVELGVVPGSMQVDAAHAIGCLHQGGGLIDLLRVTTHVEEVRRGVLSMPPKVSSITS